MFQFVRLKQYFFILHQSSLPFQRFVLSGTKYSIFCVFSSFLVLAPKNCYNNHINASEKVSVNELLSTVFLCLLHRIFFCFRSTGLSFSSVDRVSRKKTEGLPSALRRKQALRKTSPALASRFLLSAAVQIRYDNPVTAQYDPGCWLLPSSRRCFPPVCR